MGAAGGSAAGERVLPSVFLTPILKFLLQLCLSDGGEGVKDAAAAAGAAIIEAYGPTHAVSHVLPLLEAFLEEDAARTAKIAAAAASAAAAAAPAAPAAAAASASGGSKAKPGASAFTASSGPPLLPPPPPGGSLRACP